MSGASTNEAGASWDVAKELRSWCGINMELADKIVIGLTGTPRGPRGAVWCGWGGEKTNSLFHGPPKSPRLKLVHVNRGDPVLCPNLL
jgi:hypothetical protein